MTNEMTAHSLTYDVQNPAYLIGRRTVAREKDTGSQETTTTNAAWVKVTLFYSVGVKYREEWRKGNSWMEKCATISRRWTTLCAGVPFPRDQWHVYYL